MSKIKVWGVNVYIMGADHFEAEWFDSKEERDAYADSVNTPCTKLRCRMMDEDEYKEHKFFRDARW